MDSSEDYQYDIDVAKVASVGVVVCGWQLVT